MQRVATELHEALETHPDIEYSSIVLRSSWRWTHVKTGPFLARTLAELRRRIDAREVDVVLFSSMVSAALAVFLARSTNPKDVVLAAVVHGRDVTWDFGPYQRFVPRIFDALDLVLPVSRATADACLSRGLRRDRLVVVPNGISLSRFEPVRSNRKERRRVLLEQMGGDGKSEPGLLLCSVGRQVKRKGFVWFVDEVLPLLPDDVHYWLAGEGPESEDILAAARRRNVSHRVRPLGRVSECDLELLYAASDLFIMPNVPVRGDMEGFGVVMLEAGLSGLPTIASRLEGIADVIQEGKNGHLITTMDAWAFSEAIMAYYRNEAKLARAGERARSFVTERFGWSAVADRYVNELRKAATLTPVPYEAVA